MAEVKLPPPEQRATTMLVPAFGGLGSPVIDLPPYRTSKTMEIIMAVVRCDDYSPYGMTCPQCNDLMIAPSRSAYVSSNSALHCWSCDTCGHDVEIFDRFVRLSCVEAAFWRFQT